MATPPSRDINYIKRLIIKISKFKIHSVVRHKRSLTFINFGSLAVIGSSSWSFLKYTPAYS